MEVIKKRIAYLILSVVAFLLFITATYGVYSFSRYLITVASPADRWAVVFCIAVLVLPFAVLWSVDELERQRQRHV
jgi:hypothetical protein